MSSIAQLVVIAFAGLLAAADGSIQHQHDHRASREATVKSGAVVRKAISQKPFDDFDHPRRTISQHVAEHEDTHASFIQGIQTCSQRFGFNVSMPIVVTAFDDWYNEVAERWVARIKELGVSQYLMVAMTETSAALARRNAFPAITVDGECVTPELPSSLLSHEKWNLPNMLSAVKFLVPGQLMREGYERVLFSEMDIFFFENPFSATEAITGHFLAMANSDGVSCPSQPLPEDAFGGGGVNIGFMEFRSDWKEKETGQMATMVLSFGQKMATDARYSAVAADQWEFNTYVRQSPFFNTTFLAPEYFAVKGGCRTSLTKVVHFSYASPECKMARLKQLYDNPHSPVADQPGMIHNIEWLEC